MPKILGFRTNRKTKQPFPLTGGAPVNLVIKPSGMSPKKRFQSLYLVPKQKAREAIDEQKRSRIIKKLDLEKRKRQAVSQAESQKNRQDINRLLAIENARSGLGFSKLQQRGLILRDVEQEIKDKPILPARISRIGTGAFKQSVVVESSGMPKMPRKADDKSALSGIVIATAPPTTTLTSSGRSVRATGLGTLPIETRTKQTKFPSPRGSLPKGFVPVVVEPPSPRSSSIPSQQIQTQQSSTVKEKVKKDKAESKKKRKLSEEERAEKRRLEAENEGLREEKRVTAQLQAQNKRDEEKILLDEEIARQNVEAEEIRAPRNALEQNQLLFRKGGLQIE